MPDITPIYVTVKDSGFDDSSGDEVDPGVKTTALADGVDYAVLFSSQFKVQLAGNATGRFRFGASGTPSDGVELAAPKTRGGAWGDADGRMQGFTRVTGNGTDVLKFTVQSSAMGEQVGCQGGQILAIPLTIIPENEDYFYAGSDSATAQLTNASESGFDLVFEETFDLGATSDDFLVCMSVECSPGTSSSNRAAISRFMVDGGEIGSAQTIHERAGADDEWYDSACARVLNLSGSVTFRIEGQSRTAAEADFRRGRILVFRGSRFSQLNETVQATGQTTTSITDVDFISQVYTPLSTENVVILGYQHQGSTSATGGCASRLENDTDGTEFVTIAEHRQVDFGFDTGSDQKDVLLIGCESISSAKTYKTTFKKVSTANASIGKANDGSTNLDSFLITLGLTVDTTTFNIVPTPVELALTIPTPTIEQSEIELLPDPVQLVLIAPSGIVTGVPFQAAAVTGNNLFRVLCTEQVNQKMSIFVASDGILEQAVAAYLAKALDADGLTALRYSEARCAYIQFTGALSAPEDIVVPPMRKPYWVVNSTTGGQTVTFGTALGSSVTLSAGTWAKIYCDGTDCTQIF